jgi:hypothetical protein
MNAAGGWPSYVRIRMVRPQTAHSVSIWALAASAAAIPIES